MEKKPLPETKQERLEHIIEAVWDKLYTHDYKYAADTILKAMDMQNKTGGGGDTGERVVVGLPELDED